MSALLVIVVIIAILVFSKMRRTRNRDKGAKRINLLMSQVGAERYFKVGTAVAGLVATTKKGIICAPAPDDLFFMYDLMDGSNPGDPELPADELGRIPRDSVRSLEVRDLSQTQTHIQTVQRLSVTRIALLGPFSLAAPKRKRITTKSESSKFHLAIDWTDRNGIGQTTSFEFVSGVAANKAEAEIRGVLRQVTATRVNSKEPALLASSEPQIMTSVEKKCPMCAEMIKAEAIKCRYCGSNLSAV